MYIIYMYTYMLPIVGRCYNFWVPALIQIRIYIYLQYSMAFTHLAHWCCTLSCPLSYYYTHASLLFLFYVDDER